MMWVNNHHKHFYSFIAGIDQNTTSVDVIFWRRKSISVMKGLKVQPFKFPKHFDPFKPLTVHAGGGGENAHNEVIASTICWSIAGLSWFEVGPTS